MHWSVIKHAFSTSFFHGDLPLHVKRLCSNDQADRRLPV